MSRFTESGVEEAALAWAGCSSLLEQNRAIHRMLVEGVTVEYRRPDGVSSTR